MIKETLLIGVLALTGCASMPDVITYKSEPVERPALVLPDTVELELRNADWEIITEENAETLWKELQESGEPIVIYALTTEGYEALSLNMADVIKLLSQQKAVIEAYKEYYEQTEKNIDNYNNTDKKMEVKKDGFFSNWLKDNKSDNKNKQTLFD
jgi:DNA-binding PadR family transcriptional regulator